MEARRLYLDIRRIPLDNIVLGMYSDGAQMAATRFCSVCDGSFFASIIDTQGISDVVE